MTEAARPLRIVSDEASRGTGPRLVIDVARKRVESVDVLRGIVMIIMALDHTRDYFGTFGANPTDLRTASVALFLTRFVTHICAPTFFLLTGVGAGLSGLSRSKGELSRFLIARGLLLILLEVTLLRCLAYQFNFDYQVTALIVIWALGCAMIFLGLIVFLPVPVILTLGLALIAGHNLFDGVQSNHPLWLILHRPGILHLTPPTLFVAYPLIPWVGVTAVGYALAQVFTWEPERRKRFLLTAGLASIAGFLVLRGINVYGDPFPWKAQDRGGVFTVLSFLNTTKYPPSLLFLLMTLGPALLILRWTDREVPRWLRPVINYGKAPFFYFFVHFALIHWLATAVTFVQHGSPHWMFESPTLGQFPFTPPPGWGYSLPVVYGVWLFVVLGMYLPCKKVAALKASGRYKWLSYF
jgi:uncharacterized membrane protein